MTDETVGVIGAGSWGTTLAKVLGENGRRTLLWSRRSELCWEINATRRNDVYLPEIELPATVEATHDLERVSASAQLLLLVVPSHGLRQIAYELGNHVSGEHVIVHATKGIEQESFKRMSEVLREETCVRKIGVLSGPNLAARLLQQNPHLRVLFMSGYTDDQTGIHGASWGVPLLQKPFTPAKLAERVRQALDATAGR